MTLTAYLAVADYVALSSTYLVVVAVEACPASFVATAVVAT